MRAGCYDVISHSDHQLDRTPAKKTIFSKEGAESQG